MSAKPPKPLSKSDQHKIRRYIDDDGVPRFKVNKRIGLTYDQAFDEIKIATGCREEPDPADPTKTRTVWSREGIRRIGLLNDAYLAAARRFLLAKGLERAIAKKKAEAEKKQQPEQPEPTKADEPSTPS